MKMTKKIVCMIKLIIIGFIYHHMESGSFVVYIYSPVLKVSGEGFLFGMFLLLLISDIPLWKYARYFFHFLNGSFLIPFFIFFLGEKEKMSLGIYTMKRIFTQSEYDSFIKGVYSDFPEKEAFLQSSIYKEVLGQVDPLWSTRMEFLNQVDAVYDVWEASQTEISKESPALFFAIMGVLLTFMVCCGAIILFNWKEASFLKALEEVKGYHSDFVSEMVNNPELLDKAKNAIYRGTCEPVNTHHFFIVETISKLPFYKGMVGFRETDVPFDKVIDWYFSLSEQEIEKLLNVPNKEISEGLLNLLKSYGKR